MSDNVTELPKAKKPEDLLKSIDAERKESQLKQVKARLKEIDDRKFAALTTIKLCDIESQKVIQDFNDGIFVPKKDN